MTREIAFGGRPVNFTPFDLRIISSGFYGFEGNSETLSDQLQLAKIFKTATLFHYVKDAALDEWSHPRLTEQAKRGDCEDLALWLYAAMRKTGFVNLRLVVGKFKVIDKNFHVWVSYEAPNGMHYILDPAMQNHIRLRSEFDHSLYQPFYSYDHRYRYIHNALP